MVHRFRMWVPLLLACASPWAQAMDECAFGVEPTTSGFALNPVLENIVVTSARPAKPGKTCALMRGDEILQVSDMPMHGERALKAMRYWKSLGKQPATLRVKRGETLLTVTTR